MTPPDVDARRRALLEHDLDMLVEAAAGTGKTAVMAGRVALLLAAGREPGSIAAMTFGEPAAAELASRIRAFTESLARGVVPPELACALQDEVGVERRAAAARALEDLDRLAATTIHGFCRSLILSHAVEAGIDPGAVILDGDEAAALFERVLSAWLNRRLAADADADDPVAVLALEDPEHALSMLRDLARLRQASPGARVDFQPSALRTRTAAFARTVDGFARWMASVPAEPGTATLVGELSTLAAAYEAGLGGAAVFRGLWALSRPPASSAVDARGSGLAPYRIPAWMWREAAGASAAARLRNEAAAHHGDCATAHAELTTAIGSAILAALATELDGLLDDYALAKAEAAALDFDDLLSRAERLLREHPEVRRAASERYRHVLVDEVQDTDPLQAAVILAITGLDGGPGSMERRPGSLFMVGDPKQAIYRFRGADNDSHARLRAAIEAVDPDGVVRLSANFRSVPAVLAHVDRCFEGPLGERDQPGYARFEAVRPCPVGGRPGVVRLDVPSGRGSRADAVRDAEARAVAALCADLLGRPIPIGPDGVARPLRARDVALLSPTHNQLWRWERALGEAGVPVAPLAGRSLLRSQEAQDFVALACTLADPRDGLAFGALLRGPLVGMTDARLLAAMAALPPGARGRPATLVATIDPAWVEDPLLRRVLSTLQDLRVAAVRLTPEALLTEAVEALRVRAALALRSADRGVRTRANLDALLRRARPFAVRGMAAFATELRGRWEEASREHGRDLPEGRCDDGDDAVALHTVHAAKGLEWPVVIVINAVSGPRPPEAFLHRRSDGSLHGSLPRISSRGHAEAREEEGRAERRQRLRLWYVACTRARDLLVLPRLPRAREGAWSGLVDLRHEELAPFEAVGAAEPEEAPPTADANGQSAEVFSIQAARVIASAPPLAWRMPSAGDADLPLVHASAVPDPDGPGEGAPAALGAGRARGILVHKLIEEMLTGELPEDAALVGARAAILLGRTPVAAGLTGPDPAECAATALAAIALPGIAELRERLVAEWAIHVTAGDGVLVSGRADAVALDRAGRIEAVLDWKTDLDPDAATRREHAAQLMEYVVATGASRGALVYVSRREVAWIGADRTPSALGEPSGDRVAEDHAS